MNRLSVLALALLAASGAQAGEIVQRIDFSTFVASQPGNVLQRFFYFSPGFIRTFDALGGPGVLASTTVAFRGGLFASYEVDGLPAATTIFAATRAPIEAPGSMLGGVRLPFVSVTATAECEAETACVAYAERTFDMAMTDDDLAPWRGPDIVLPQPLAFAVDVYGFLSLPLEAPIGVARAGFTPGTYLEVRYNYVPEPNGAALVALALGAALIVSTRRRASITRTKRGRHEPSA